jgi:hypothetical protein
MTKKKVEVWIDSSGYVRVREERDKNHWELAVLKPILVKTTYEQKEFH